MLKSIPPLNWFRAFECAAKHLSFTVAADELNLTQSAISQHVRSLESHFGEALFIRKTRGLALTDSGRRLLPYVSNAITELAEGAAMFNQRKPDCALTIACSFSFSLLWLAPRLNQFLATHPSLDIRIISTLWPDDYLLSEADIEIRFGSQELVGERATLLVSDVIVPVCSPAMADSLTSWTEICQQPLIQTAGMSDTWQCWADALGLEPPPPVSISVDTSALALEIVRNSSSVTLVNRLLANQLILSNKLAMPLCSSTKAKDNYFVKVRGNTSQDSIAHNFVDWLMLEASNEATV